MKNRLSPLALSLIPLCTIGATAGSKSKERPNVIVILADDLGYNDVGFNGAKDIKTPHIDYIAKQGVKFTAAYVAYSVSGPSRAALLTGRYGQRFGFERNPLYRPNDPEMGLTRNESTIAETLSKVGYYSGIIGKWHMGAHIQLHPLNRGFNEFFGHLGGGHQYFPEKFIFRDSYSVSSESDSYATWIMKDHAPVKVDEYLTDAFSHEAVRFVEQNKNRPFFLYLSYNAPHSPLQATEKLLARYPEIKDIRRKTYAAMVSAVDDGVGELIKTLKKNGMEKNTLIFFLSDNGGPEKDNASDNGPLREGKSSVYEGGFRVPFAMMWKGKITKGVYRLPISSLDIFATVAAITGAPIDPKKPLDGVNLLPYLAHKASGAPHSTIYLRKYDEQKFAIRYNDYKLVTTKNGANKELYHISEDIGETNNIANQHPGMVTFIDSLRNEWNKGLIAPTFEGLMTKKRAEKAVTEE